MATEHPPPDPIWHLADAVTALGFALRDLSAGTHDSRCSGAVRQDSLEHLSEAELLIELAHRRLNDPPRS